MNPKTLIYAGIQDIKKMLEYIQAMTEKEKLELQSRIRESVLRPTRAESKKGISRERFDTLAKGL